MQRNAVFKRGTSSVEGVSAEILSVLFTETSFSARLPSDVSEEEIVSALDTRLPDEERVRSALRIAQAFAEASRLGRWLPRHAQLAQLEYSNQFYSGYRDHTIHSLAVYLFGCYLFERNTAIQHALNTYLRGVAGVGLSDAEAFHEWWTVTALWHDWGYPFETTDIIKDTQKRAGILRNVTQDVQTNAFKPALENALGTTLADRELRAIYGDGHYFPFEITNIDDLFPSPDSSLARMFWRLGADKLNDPIRALRTLTTEAPVDRPPYYDHGLVGACLLEKWWSVVDRFVLEFETSKRQMTALVPKDIRTKLAYEVVELDGLLHAATEAIAFHNFAFRSWPTNELERVLRPGTRFMMPGLSQEPHLFFVSLVDTLQDWDRHHFVPLGTASYRPAVPASQMMLQASGDKIRASLGKPNTVAQLLRLFEGWLDRDSCTALFAEQPHYTCAAEVFDVVAVSVEQTDVSAKTLEQACAELQTVVTAVRKKLIDNPTGELATSCIDLESAHQFLTRRRITMLPRDNDLLDDRAEWRDYLQLKRVVASLIQLGSVVPRGSITQKLGEGGFGTVYAVHPSTAADYSLAYKVYHASELDNEIKKRLFRRGYEAMQRIGIYPGVVQVHEFTEFPLGFFMDLVPGKNLQEALPPISDVHARVQILQQIAETLAYSHERGVIHRDVKPANVILDSQTGRPILTDFDLAWITDRTSDTAAGYASLQYGAPEQFQSGMTVFRERPTVDIYSFGALALYVLSGKEPAPFFSMTEDSMRSAMRYGMAGKVLASGIDSLCALVIHCLRHDPTARPTSMRQVLDRIRRTRLQSLEDALDLKPGEFELEVVTATGLAFKGLDGESQAGRVKVSIAMKMTQAGIGDFVVDVRLQAQPTYNVVSQDVYRRSTVPKLRRVVDRCAAKLKGKSEIASSPTNWTLRIRGVRLTARSAWTLGDMVRDAVAAVE